MIARKRPYLNLMTVVRCAALVIVFVFAHDVMMTLQPHHAVAESAHHDIVQVQECGNTEGIATQQFGSPVESPTANLTAAGIYRADTASASLTREPLFVEPDASARRAWLQVFLN